MKVAILWLINEKGETYGEAVRRESQEELGLTDADFSSTFLHKDTFAGHTDGKKREFGLFYAPVTSHITARIKLEPNEVSEIKWFRKSELEHLVNEQSESLIISSAKELWDSIFHQLQPVTAS